MSKKKITELAPAQVIRLEEVREEWRAYGLSTARADRTKAEAAVTEMYKRLGKPAPRFLWFESPMSAVLGIRWYQKHGATWAELAVKGLHVLGDQIASQLGSQLRNQLRSQLASQLESQLGSQLASQLEDLMSESDPGAKSLLYWYLWGQHEAYWIVFYKFAEEIGVKYAPDDSQLLDYWGDLAKSCSWWWPFEGAVVFSERPVTVKFDPAGRLHAEKGPAIQYADGYSLYAWHGTRVPEQWITHTQDQNPADALTWPNIEQRRALAEILTWERVLGQLASKTIDANPNPEIGTLLTVDLPDAPGERFLRVKCGTGRFFTIPVPREMRTALEANAWTYGVPESVIAALEIRT